MHPDVLPSAGENYWGADHRWHRFRFLMRGQAFQVDRDGVTIMEGSDDRIKSGQIFLEIKSGLTVYLDNIIVVSLE